MVAQRCRPRTTIGRDIICRGAASAVSTRSRISSLSTLPLGARRSFNSRSLFHRFASEVEGVLVLSSAHVKIDLETNLILYLHQYPGSTARYSFQASTDHLRWVKIG